MADGYISQIKTPDNKVYDFRDQHLKVYTGSCTTAAGTAIKDVTTDGEFTLAKGAVIFVNFSATNSAAVGNLKLKFNGEADTNAKPIKYLVNGNDPANIPGAGYLRANQTYMFQYDGTNWVAVLNYYTYSNNFASMVGHYNNILARKAITAESLIVGDATGYEKVASGVTFDLAYPIVWCTANVAANASNYANMYLQHYDRNIATGAKSGFTSAANKVIYLIVTISGNIATIDSNIITDTLPSSDDGKVYISLGKLGAQSTGANYFFLYPVHPMFWYKNGAIREYGGGSGIKDITRSGTTFTATRDDGSTFTFTQQDTNKYHKSGSWSGLTYTATAVNDADELKFTLPTGTTATTLATGNHSHTLKIGNKSLSVSTSEQEWTVHDILKTSTNIGTDTSWDQYEPGVYYVASGSTFTGTNNPENANTNNGITPYHYGQLIVSRAATGGVAQFYISHNDSNNANYGIHYRTGWNNTYVAKWSVLLDSQNYTNYTVTKTGTGASGTWDISITGTAAKATADASGNTITSTYATKTEIEGLLAAADAMIFKGVINATNALPNSHKAGETYRVGTVGTYPIVDSNGRYCEIGTLIICTTEGTAANAAHWTSVETNEDGAVIGPASSTDNAIARWDGATGRIIQNSTVTINDNGSVYTERAGEVGYVAKNTTKAHQVEFIVSDSGNGGIFDRTKAKWIVYSDTSGNAVLNGNANTATKLETARNLGVALGSTTAVTFDGNANQTSIPVSGTLGIAHGGTGATSAADARTNLNTVTGNARVFYGTCNTAAATTLKEVICAQYDKILTIGDMLIVKFDNTNSGAVGNLQITVKNSTSDSAGTTAKNIKRQYNSTGANNLVATGELNKDSIAVFVYNGTYWILTNADYNNTYSYDWTTGAGGNGRTAETAANGGVGIHRYSLQMMTLNLTWSSLSSDHPTAATTNGAATDKTVATCSFLLDSPIIYQDTNANAIPGNSANVNGFTTGAINLQYSTTNAQWSALTIQKPVYLIGTLQSDGTFKLNATKWWTQTLPTSDDGQIYIFLGMAYSATNIYLHDAHPIYWYKNGEIQPYAGYATATSRAAITTTANAVAYYTNTTGTFGSKASANGALYATSANGALQWGTLPIAQGGTGVVSFTKNQVILSDNTNGTTGLTSRAYSDSTSAEALSNSSTNFVTERDVYFGLPTLNNAHNYTSSSTYYAPTTGGTAGHILIGAGVTTAPAWYGGTVMSGSAAASWITTFNGTTDATATNAAAVTIAGGLGISKKLYVGDTATVPDLTIGSTNEYGDAYTPIYWHEGVPTTVTLVQQCAFTIKSGKSGVKLSHAAITANSYVTQIVVTSGEANLNSAISWTSAAGYIELTCSSTVSGDVTGYIMISRGGEITATATDIT